jgi:hypothetical protein
MATYEELIAAMKQYANEQKACGNPATMKDLREFRQWKNMPQDPEFDWILLEDVNLREDK